MKNIEDIGMKKVLMAICTYAVGLIGAGLIARMLWESFMLGWNLVGFFL